MKNYDLMIIGGCASGLAAAINAKRLAPEARIAVAERLPRVGKKLLATGNGRCNLTNIYALGHEYKNRVFALTALEKYPPERVVDFFATLGLRCRTDGEGRVYPRSNAASSVLDALRFEVERLGVEVLCDTPINSIKKNGQKFIINNSFAADRAMIACGGRSSPSQGSDGSGYALAEMLDHKVTELRPALVPLVAADPAEVRPLKGIRAANVSLRLESGGKSASSQGEILFTDSGISGIAAMELAPHIADKQKAFTHIDFIPELDLKALTEYICSLRHIKGERPLDDLLSGILVKQLGVQICKARILYKGDRKIETLTDDECAAIACKVKDYTVAVSGVKGFNDSQVTSGGVNVGEIDPATMQSRLVKGLYFAGEIIDVDGGCGGFNLQWAWASGLLAGESVFGR